MATPREEDALAKLNAKERAVFDLLIERKSFKEIAKILGTSRFLVEQRVWAIKRKLGVSTLGELASAFSDYRELVAASPQARIAMIREGLAAIEAKRLVQQALGIEEIVLYDPIGLEIPTVNRKITQSEQLAGDESERLLSVARLIGQVEAIMAESGDVQGFDAPEWLSRWLGEPLPALGGIPPMALLDTMEGQAMVAEALARIQSGAYA